MSSPKFKFDLIGGHERPFLGYLSSIDKTNIDPRALVRGSKNVYKNLKGNIQNRCGLLRRGIADATVAAVISSFEWQTSFGLTRVIRAADGKLQVEYETASGFNWYDITTGLASDEQLFSFAPWYSESLAKDQLIMVNGKQEIDMWSGGVGVLESATANTITLADTTNVQRLGFDSTGSLLIGGTTYAYTGAGFLENSVYSQTPTTLTPSLTTTVWHSQLFTTSAAGTGITRAIITVRAAGASVVTSRFTARIYTDNAGSPGTLVGSANGTIPGAHSSGDWPVTFSFTELSASPLTNYHVVISLVSSGTTFQVLTGNTGAVGTNISSDSGATWGAENGYLYATIYENTVSGNTFTGVTPSPAAITVGTVVVQTLVVSTTTTSGGTFSNVFGRDFTNDWIAVIGNQLYVGCYTARPVFISSSGSDLSGTYRTFAVPSFRAPGDPDLLILDTNSRGATSKTGQKGNALVFGSQGDSYSVVRQVETFVASASVQYIYEVAIVDKSTSSDLSSPLGQDFIGSIGDTIIFFDESNQLRQYGTLKDLNTPVFPILSLDIYTELTDYDFTGGHLRTVSEQSGETVYITSPLAGVTFIYQIREKVDYVGNATAERLWYSPFIISASRVAVIEGVTYVHSSQNPQLYQLWDTDQWSDDSPSDEAINYVSVARFAYRHDKRSNLINFDKVYWEGYMTEGTELNSVIRFDYLGVTGVQEPPINSTDRPAKFFYGTGGVSLGDGSLGENSLGDSLAPDSSDDIEKFRVITPINPNGTDCFEYQLEANSVNAGDRWEIIAVGPNTTERAVDPAFLMN